MNVTSSTNTSYVYTPNFKVADTETEEYKSTNTAVESESNITNWAYQLNRDINNLLTSSSSNSSVNFQSSLIKDELESKISQYAQILMDENGDTPKSELQNSKQLNEYKNELLKEYKASIENSTDGVLNAQHVAIIKTLMQENTNEASSLEKLLAQTTSSASQVTSTSTNATKTVSTDPKMAEMQEKYKDVYTPIPETYSKADEDLQLRKIHEAYPNYISGPDFLKIADSFLEGPKIELGQKLSPEEDAKQRADYEQAFQKAYDIFGGQEAFIKMQKGAMEIMQKYPVNTWGKDERVHNATELAHFTNAATYEGLEQGKTVEEAKIYAINLRSSFMDTSYSTINFLETLIKAGRADPNALDWFLNQDERYYPKNSNDIDFNASHNVTMDLREYGIEGSWEFYEVVESQKGMIAEIEKKIGQFQFMLNNESKIKEAYSKLEADAQTLGNNAGYKRMINEDYMPRMQDGLNIFKNYKIYDN